MSFGFSPNHPLNLSSPSVPHPPYNQSPTPNDRHAFLDQRKKDRIKNSLIQQLGHNVNNLDYHIIAISHFPL